MNHKLLLIALTSISLLISCAHMAPLSQPINQKLSKNERSAQLNAITEWKLKGAISITEPAQHFSASVVWQQNSLNHYKIYFYGPLGVGSAKLNSTQGGVELTNTKGDTFAATSPETLVQKQLRITLPISDLQYWIRALPAPNKIFSAKYDQYNHITELEQEGWTITYLSYMASAGTDLPKKMQLQHGNIKAKIAIVHWNS